MEDQILKRITSSPWDSSLPFSLQQRQENLPGVPETELPEEVTCLDTGSQIQQILEKCCGELNSSSDNNTHFEGIFYFKAFVSVLLYRMRSLIKIMYIQYSLYLAYICNKCSAQQNSCFNGTKYFIALHISTLCSAPRG